jgi:hypothetical protein
MGRLDNLKKKDPMQQQSQKANAVGNFGDTQVKQQAQAQPQPQDDPMANMLANAMGKKKKQQQ